MTDPIVEETRRAGQALFARHGNDLHAVVEHLRRRSEQAGRPTIALPPKPAKLIPSPSPNKKVG